MVTTIKVSLPEELVSQAQQFVRDGWTTDFDGLLTEALRRYLDYHGSELAEKFIREDVSWGLHGKD